MPGHLALKRRLSGNSDGISNGRNGARFRSAAHDPRLCENLRLCYDLVVQLACKRKRRAVRPRTNEKPDLVPQCSLLCCSKFFEWHLDRLEVQPIHWNLPLVVEVSKLVFLGIFGDQAGYVQSFEHRMRQLAAPNSIRLHR